MNFPSHAAEPVSEMTDNLGGSRLKSNSGGWIIVLFKSGDIMLPVLMLSSNVHKSVTTIQVSIFIPPCHVKKYIYIWTTNSKYLDKPSHLLSPSRVFAVLSSLNEQLLYCKSDSIDGDI